MQFSLKQENYDQFYTLGFNKAREEVYFKDTKAKLVTFILTFKRTGESF